MKNILLIGGSGFIGTNLAAYMADKNYKIVIYDKLKSSNIVHHPNVEYVIGNVDDRSFNELCSWATLVIYLASSIIPSMQISAIEPINSELSNLERIFKIIKKTGAKFIYFSSGGAVYGEATLKEYRENDSCRPRSSYGIVKYTAELFIENELRETSVEYIIVRPSNPYGPRHNPESRQGVVNVFINKILNDDVIRVFGKPEEIIKDYIYIDDLVECVYLLSCSSVKNTIINVGSAIGVSLSEIIKIISYQVGVIENVKYEHSLKTDVQRFVLNIDKATSLLKWKPVTKIDDGIRKTLEWMRGRSNSPGNK